MTKTKAKKTIQQAMDKSVEASNKKLQPLIEWAAANSGKSGKPGAFPIIAEAMSKKLGRAVKRQLVSCWLHSDPAKRKQPLFGTGLLLVETGEELLKSHDNANKPS